MRASTREICGRELVVGFLDEAARTGQIPLSSGRVRVGVTDSYDMVEVSVCWGRADVDMGFYTSARDGVVESIWARAWCISSGVAPVGGKWCGDSVIGKEFFFSMVSFLCCGFSMVNDLVSFLF